jgi:hypothetical protein
MIYNFMTDSALPGDPDAPCLRPEVDRIMRRDWPNIVIPVFRRQYSFEGPGILELSGHTVDEFLGRTKFKQLDDPKA